METMNMTNQSLWIATEPWFLPLDIIMIVTTSLSIVLGLVFLCIAITHRTCWSVQMLLTCNSCLAEVLLSCALLNMAVFTFQQDLNHSSRDISFCIGLGFVGFAADSLQNYSYLLMAIYRYIVVVHPTRIFWQSAKFQLVLISIQWIFSIVYGLPILLTGGITYNVANQICQIPLQLSVSMIYVASVIYFIPNMSIVVIYIRLTRYVHEMSRRTTAAHTLFHARRELRLVQRTFILTNTLIIVGIPYAAFVFMSLFTTPPKYHFRIAYVAVDVSILTIMVILYCFTSQIKTILQKKFTRETAVQPMAFTART